jgi:hypothetical protein
MMVRMYGKETRENGRIGEEMVEKELNMEEMMTHLRKVAFEGGTVGTGKAPPRPFLRHQWTYQHQNAMQRWDFENFGTDTLMIRTDFAAQHECKPQDTKTCASSNHANLDVFIVQHSPRMVEVADKSGRKGLRRVVTTDTWRFWQPASGKCNDADWVTHNQNLDHLVDYYVTWGKNRDAHNGDWRRPAIDGRLPKLEILAPIKRVLLWTDGCPGQYKCRQNFLKVAQFPQRHPGLELVHSFAATGQFKGLHDAAGKTAKTNLTKRELREQAGTRCTSAKRCYKASAATMTRPRHTQQDTPEAWFARDDNHQDRYFWRFTTSDVNDPDLQAALAAWSAAASMAARTAAAAAAEVARVAVAEASAKVAEHAEDRPGADTMQPDAQEAAEGRSALAGAVTTAVTAAGSQALPGLSADVVVFVDRSNVGDANQVKGCKSKYQFEGKDQAQSGTAQLLVRPFS